MWSKILTLFNKIKKRDYWNDKWKEKAIINNKNKIVSIIKRKFREDEVKEICMDNKNNIISIREYRYDSSGMLYKLVLKAWDGSVKCINDVRYKDGNVYVIEMNYIEEENGVTRRFHIYEDRIKEFKTVEQMQECIEYMSNSLKERSNKNYIESLEEIYYENSNNLVVEKLFIPIVEEEYTGTSIEDKLYYRFNLSY